MRFTPPKLPACAQEAKEVVEVPFPPGADHDRGELQVRGSRPLLKAAWGPLPHLLSLRPPCMR